MDKSAVKLLLPTLALFFTVPAKADRNDCPAKAKVEETRKRNESLGHHLDEGFYVGLENHAYQECENVEREIQRLAQPFNEFRQGKRDDRDGYILASQLWSKFLILRTTTSSDAKAVKRELDALLQKHPEFKTLGDFRLSDEIEKEAADRRRASQIAEAAKGWKPPDKIPLTAYGKPPYLALFYQYRIAYYHLPNRSELELQNREKLLIALRLQNTSYFNLGDFKPEKVISFRRTIDHVETTTHALVCTIEYPLGDQYAPMNEVERSAMLAAGNPAWTNRDTAAIDDFCGVISQTGEVLYRFPGRQHDPDTLFKPVRIEPDGLSVLGVGRRVERETDDDPYSDVGEIRELFIWKGSSKVESRKINPPAPNWIDFRLKGSFR